MAASFKKYASEALVETKAPGEHAEQHKADGKDPLSYDKVAAAPAGLVTGYYTASTDEQLDSILQSVLASMAVRTQKIINVYLDSTEPVFQRWHLVYNH